MLRRNPALAAEFGGDQESNQPGEWCQSELPIRPNRYDKNGFTADCDGIDIELKNYRERLVHVSQYLALTRDSIAAWPQTEVQIESSGIGFSCTVGRGDRGATLEVLLGSELTAQPVVTLYFRAPGSPDYRYHRNFNHIATAMRSMRRLLRVKL